MDITPTLEIPVSSIELESCSIECSSQVKPEDFTFYLQDRLRTLYAQSFRTTLAPPVLPRLMAQS